MSFFVDTNSRTAASMEIPSEAVAIYDKGSLFLLDHVESPAFVEDDQGRASMEQDGLTFWNGIEGFRTLYVTGREALSQNIDTYDITSGDGDVFKKNRFPARTITVGYQLISKNAKDFREKYNRFSAFLLSRTNDKNAALKWMFADELDKYFVGYVSDISTPDPGRLSVVGEFNIVCLDPYKYSVEEKSATLVRNGEVRVDNCGVAPVYPTISASFPEKCGWFSVTCANKATLTFGTEGVGDMTSSEQRMVNENFDGSLQGWRLNDGKLTYDGYTQQGGASTKTYDGLSFVSGDSFGTGQSWLGSNNWHGPSLSKIIPADGAGNTNATDFGMVYSIFERVSSWEAYKLTGEVVNIGETGKTVLVAVVVEKHANDTARHITVMVNGDAVATTEIQSNDLLGHGYDPTTGYSTSYFPVSISKSGGIVSVSVNFWNFTIERASLASSAGHEITLWMAQQNTVNHAYYAGYGNVNFTRRNAATYGDAVRVFDAGDRFEETEDWNLLRNGVPADDYGQLSNNFEAFQIPPQSDVPIYLTASDWADASPEVQIKWRERWI